MKTKEDVERLGERQLWEVIRKNTVKKDRVLQFQILAWFIIRVSRDLLIIFFYIQSGRHLTNRNFLYKCFL